MLHGNCITKEDHQAEAPKNHEKDMSQKYPKLETKLYIDITFTDYKALRYKMTRSCHTSRTEGELLKSYLYTSLLVFDSASIKIYVVFKSNLAVFRL